MSTLLIINDRETILFVSISRGVRTLLIVYDMESMLFVLFKARSEDSFYRL